MRRKMIILSYVLFPVTGLLLVSDNVVSAATTYPNNTAVFSGTPASYLNCSIDSATSNNMIWAFTAIGSTQYKTIVVGCNPPTLPQYGAQSLTSDGCNLIIYNVNASYAGLYQCSSTATSAVLSAQLIVLETSATCSNTLEGSNQHKLTCGIGYAGNMKPSVTWFDGTNQEISSTPDSSGSYVTASFSVSGSEVPPNICQANFTPPSNPPANYASNAPDFTSMCNVTSYTVTAATENAITTESINNKYSRHSGTGWEIAFWIFCVLLIGVVVVNILYFTKYKDKLLCRKQSGIDRCGRKGCIGGLISAAIIGLGGTIVGGLLAGGVIPVGASSECCFGWIGGFTIVISLSVCGGIIILCQALNCRKKLKKSVAPEAYTNGPDLPRGKNQTMDYVSHRTS